MKIYVFGNRDDAADSLSLEVVDRVKNDYSQIEFVFVKPNEDLPFVGENHVTLLDCVAGVKNITVLDETQLHLLTLSPRSTVHDFDLGFQLRYLQKIGKLQKVTIIGLPMGKSVDYDSLHSILRKLVAQDIQGS